MEFQCHTVTQLIVTNQKLNEIMSYLSVWLLPQVTVDGLCVLTPILDGELTVGPAAIGRQDEKRPKGHQNNQDRRAGAEHFRWGGRCFDAAALSCSTE